MIQNALCSVSLKNYTTLRAGGSAELFTVCRTVDELADCAIEAQLSGLKTTYLGSGSNVLPSDAGVPGLVAHNIATELVIHQGGIVTASTGLSFQELFIKAAQSNLAGLEYAVGIPGSIGGALVSNAGAYRSSIEEHLTRVEVVIDGVRKWVEPSILEFSYRDSILRRMPNTPLCLLQIELKLPKGDPLAIYEEAREYQRQRIAKQPPPASCGSFFKNVTNLELADKLPQLRPDLKLAGVIPAGVLIEQSGLRGFLHKGAMLSERHANFILNVGDASATSIRSLAEFAKEKVFQTFDVLLEEEALYLGDWSGYERETVN